MLNDAGVGCLGVGVVHHGVALIVVGVQHLRLKADAAVLQSTQLVIKVGVHRARVDDLIRQLVQLRPAGQVIHTQLNLHAVQHLLHHGRVAAVGDSLIQGVKIVVIVGKTDGQPLDDERGQLGAGAAPLFASVALDELLVDVGAHQTDGLFLEVLRLGDACCLSLFFDLSGCFFRCHHTPHLIEGIHIKRQAVQLTLVICHRGVRKAVKLRKRCHIIPHFFVVGVENMRTVFMYMNPFDLLCIHISCDVWAFVDYQHLFPFFYRFPGKYGAVQTGSYDNIIICFHFVSPCIFFFPSRCRFFHYIQPPAKCHPFSFSARFVSFLQPCEFPKFCKIMEELRK